VTIAQEIVKHAPDNGIYWITLGAAFYAAGNYRSAAESLEKATQLPNRDVSYALFLLAMTYRQLDDKAQAHKWYDLAATQVHLHELRYSEIVRFHAEAEALLQE
jgi:uncharacterized protein HemY